MLDMKGGNLYGSLFGVHTKMQLHLKAEEFMKKIIPLLLPLILTACASGTNYTQLTTQSSEQIDLSTLPPLVEEVVIPDVPPPSLADQLALKFTLQVVSMRHGDGFEKYVNELPDNAPFWSNQKVVKGVLWYSLLYGEYDSKAQAEEALRKLPANVQKFGPFVRSFSTILSAPESQISRLK